MPWTVDENARKGKNEDPAAPMGTNIHYGESTRIQKIHDEMKVWLKNLEFRGALKLSFLENTLRTVVNNQ